MALIGTIEPFKGSSDEFESYLERMEYLFKVNALEDDMKISLFITLAGTNVYHTLKSLIAPQKPEDLTFAGIKDKLLKHFKPPVTEIFERFVFNKANQKADQSIAEYVVELKKLASTCKFGNFLEEALRDRFVCGIRSESIQRKLLAEVGLNFQQACKIAQATELAQKQVRSLLQESSDGNVNSVHHRGGKSTGSKDHKKANMTVKSQSNKNQLVNQPISSKCGKCGRSHEKDDCPAVKWKCFRCNKFGHVRWLCPKKTGMVASVEEEDVDEEAVNSDLLSLNQINEGMASPCRVLIKINGKPIMFEIDTRACRTVISLSSFRKDINVELQDVNYKLNVVSGQEIKAIGECIVSVGYVKKYFDLILTVIESKKDFVPLLGRNWLNVLCPDWQSKLGISNVSINCISSKISKELEIAEFKKKYGNVFDEKLCSPIHDFEVSFNIKEGAVPVVKKAYSMPYALKGKIENKLRAMVTVGILEPVAHSEWASPIVVVSKKNSEDVRICSDFRLTVNKVLNIDQYPLPTPDDIFASLVGGKVFSVLDLSGAYQQVKVKQECQKYLTINTHIGLFRYTRLTFGIACAPAIFQSVMDQILCGIPNVHCYLDDILIAGSSFNQAKELLDLVLQRLSKYNVKINLNKCIFFESSVEYLGHRIDSVGIHPTIEKVRAIIEVPEPENLSQLRSYLGLINYYSKFIPMLSSELKPLYNLLKISVEFKFDKSCQDAFKLSKELITNNQVLVHYDPKKTIVISCDASSYGVGGVLSHRDAKGVEKPICYTSSSLSKSEKNYSQLEREALAIIFSVKKFHKYIYGRPFVLVSDHQPLKVIFKPDRSMSVMAASRIVRWSVVLSAYDYKIEYRKGKDLVEADALSRLPLKDKTGIDSEINSFNLSEELPLSWTDIAKVSSKDPIIRKVINFVKTGWPNSVSGELKPYYIKRNELTIEENCLMLGSKVIIPENLRNSILELLHEDHIGMVRTKILARSAVWWPGIQEDIETKIDSCTICKANQNNHEKFLIAWPKTDNVFQRIHVDFFYKDTVPLLLIVDSRSRWIDIHVMSKGYNITQTVEKLKSTFAIMGLPETIVSDNGPPFNSKEFDKFCMTNGINILKSPPYHPQSNGLAERHVQNAKTALNKFMFQKSTLNIEQQIVNFLFSYRNTPCVMTKLSPNEMVFKVKPKTRLDLIKPKKGGKVMFSENFDYVKPEIFETGENVFVGKLGPFCKDKWKEGNIVKRISSLTYLVEVEGKMYYKHVNSLRKRRVIEEATEQPEMTLPTYVNEKS